MPDRAVVDDTRQLTISHDEGSLILNLVLLEESRLRAIPPVFPTSSDTTFADYWDEKHQQLIASAASIREKLCDESLQPRAVVAISEDRSWLVVLDPCYNTPARWKFFRRKEYAYYAALRENQIADTGQSADEVLVAFLEGSG